MFKGTRKKEFGQALVETAITMPILILILSGLLDLGRVYYTFIALEEAAAEAARFLAIDPGCAGPVDPEPLDAPNVCANPNNALYRANNAGSDEFDIAAIEWNIPYDAATTDPDFVDPFNQCGGSSVGSYSIGCVVVVQLKYEYDFITPGIEAIANTVSNGAGLTLRVQATEIIVYE
jgi:hypothetical protein